MLRARVVAAETSNDAENSSSDCSTGNTDSRCRAMSVSFVETMTN